MNKFNNNDNNISNNKRIAEFLTNAMPIVINNDFYTMIIINLYTYFCLERRCRNEKAKKKF